MKALVFSLGLGCSQFLMDQTCAFVDQSLKKEVERKIIVVDERWGCSRCGNDNGDWTSICGRCGRSK